MANNDLRSQLKATSIKKLKKSVEKDNDLIGASNNEYLNLEDGKTVKIRIFPGHPGAENFYVPKKCYWLTVAGNDGEPRRTTVNDSKVHGGTKYDVVEEYTKLAKKACAGNTTKMEAISGQKDSLNPQYSWLSYGSKINAEDALHPMIWEFKKMVRDALNKLAFSEDEDDAIEIDPFTDPDEGLPILVKYMKNPNRKKGENYYEVSFPKKVTARPLTDEEVEAFMKLKPLSEVIPIYGMKDFDRALEGLQNFDEENDIDLFSDDDWLELVETIKSQYEAEEAEEAPKKKTTKTVSKTTSKKQVEEDEDEVPVKKVAKKAVKEPEPEVEEEDEEEAEEGDGFDDLDRNELKKYIKDNELEVVVKKSMSDDDIRNLIREAIKEVAEEDEEETEEEDEVEEEPAPKAKVTLADIKKKLAGKK